MPPLTGNIFVPGPNFYIFSLLRMLPECKPENHLISFGKNLKASG